MENAAKPDPDSLRLTQQNPIAAIATPVGEGGIAVIRVSGRDCIRMIATIFRGRDLNKAASHTVHFGRIVRPNVAEAGIGADPGAVSGQGGSGGTDEAVVDEVLATVFRSPRSYTGEDSVEISCHGGVLVTQAVLEAVLATGIRAAGPGEFTQRAFLNGKLELSQAEAVADLIHARSRKAVEAAQQQLEGRLGGYIREFRQQIIDATAMIELELDFIEEDVEFASKPELMKLLGDLDESITRLLSTYETGRIVKHGIRTVFAGKPNAGKSTLMNTLVGRDRAIVSEIAGTTRDVIDADWNYDGLLFTLTDTAGLRETIDLIEAEGVRRSRKALQEADLIVYLVDLSQPADPAEMQAIDRLRADYPGKSILVAGNKIDKIRETATEGRPPTDLEISATEGTSIDRLKERMKQSVLANREIDTSALLVTSSRHVDALEKTRKHVHDAIRAIESGSSGDFVSIDLRAALHELGTITGEITTEDLLDSIFSRFCIGK